MPKTTKSTKQNNSVMAVVAYILFFIPLLTESKKDPFVMFHIKQGLIVFILGVAIFIINIMVPWYWFSIGWILNILSLGVAVLAIIGIINALNGKKEELPLVGQFADKIKL